MSKSENVEKILKVLYERINYIVNIDNFTFDDIGLFSQGEGARYLDPNTYLSKTKTTENGCDVFIKYNNKNSDINVIAEHLNYIEANGLHHLLVDAAKMVKTSRAIRANMPSNMFYNRIY